jgi:hypothetical protein
MRLGLLPLIAIAMGTSNAAAQISPAASILIDTCLGRQIRIPLEHPGKQRDPECAVACHAICSRRTHLANRAG